MTELPNFCLQLGFSPFALVAVDVVGSLICWPTPQLNETLRVPVHLHDNQCSAFCCSQEIAY